jgi:very-short-patch-repair endonuclease
MRTKRAAPWRSVAEIAARQHGVIDHRQLLLAGLSRSAVKRGVASGRVHRVYRGVYAVGHTELSEKGRWIAAVLACGPKAALSHASAAQLWSLSPRSPSWADVTVPGHGGRARREGIVLHRSATLRPIDVTRRQNIPVTTQARILRDMGWAKERTRSDLERAFLRLLRSHELPLPEVNACLGPYEVDFLWRAECLVVETDGWEFHRSRASFESDRRRDRELQARGFVVLRFAYREVIEEPDTVVASLRAHLPRRRGLGFQRGLPRRQDRHPGERHQ